MTIVKKKSSSSSSSSSRAASTDIPDPLLPLFPIVHRLWHVFWATSRTSHSFCMYDLAGRPAFARAYVGVHRSTSLMSSSLLLQQCPTRLVRLTWIVFVMGGKWPYSWCLVGCCRQDLFNIARNILVELPSTLGILTWKTIILSLEFFTLVLADSLSLKFESHHVSSSLQNFSQDSGRS